MISSACFLLLSELAKQIIAAASEEAKIIASERSKKQAEDIMEQELGEKQGEEQ